MKNSVFLYGLLIVLVILPGFVYGDIPAGERAALIALYQAADGDNWKNNSGWKTPPLHSDGFALPGTEDNWYGVMLWWGRENIAQVDLEDNNLHGFIPLELGNLSKLDTLRLENNFLTGSIPPELGNLTGLIILYLNGNQLSGAIPPEMAGMSGLATLRLQNNQLSGAIPPELGHMSALGYLDLSGNELSGHIPAELGNITGLSYLYLGHNQLTGSIPLDLGNLHNLHVLDLSHNGLTGNIPPGLGDINGYRIFSLYLNNNLLTGAIPAKLAASTNLFLLDISHNQLTGSIHPGFGESNTLRYLILKGNRLTGEIPSTFTAFMDPNRALDLDIKYNGLYTDNLDLRFFLNEINRGWEDTQTIDPAGVSALTLSTSAVKLSWAPILYKEDGGGYEIYYSTTPGGPWTYSGITGDKSAVSYIVNGLNPGALYYFRIRTRTGPHVNNQNTVTSEPGKEVSAVTDAVVSTCRLSVRSEPQSGVTIAVAPADNNGQTGGNTNFTRVYTRGAAVTLTAPAVYQGGDFLKWTVDGLDYLDGVLELIVYDDHEITAFYGKSGVEVTVTTTEDGVPGSLRDVLDGANARDKDTAILLPAGTYFLAGAEIEDGNRGGDLDIDTGHHITITGEGAGKTIIDGSQIGRVLHIINGKVSVSGVTFRNGKTRSGICGDAKEGNGGDGGGIYNCGILDLSGCHVKNNTTGSGITADDGCPGSQDCHGGRGGGIYNGGTLNLRNSIISHNQTGGGEEGGDGGGIYNAAGKASLVNCTVSDNTAGGKWGQGANGGGVYNTGILNISRSGIISNRVRPKSLPEYTYPPPVKITGGGGIFNDGTLTLTAATVSDNYTLMGSGCGDSGGGAGIYNKKSAVLENCTVSGNKTGDGGTCLCETPPGGNAGDGGGIYSEGTLKITGCTICNNMTGKHGFFSYYPYSGHDGCGGGIYIKYGTAAVRNTIIAGNRVINDGEGPDCYGTVNSKGYNLVGDPAGCDIKGILTGNITGQDPLLGVLADNGGPTSTHALLPASPAIDAGDSSNLTHDQRGIPRPVDIASAANVSDGADIGAYEYNPKHNPPVYYRIQGKITLNGTGLSGVMVTFSNGGGTAVTNEGGNYSGEVPSGWTGKAAPVKDGFTFMPAMKEYAPLYAHQTGQNYTASERVVPGVPAIFLDPVRLNFSADLSGHHSGSQKFLIDNSGGGTLNWSIDGDVNWLHCSPTTGNGPALVTVSIDPAQLAGGTYTGTITVWDANAENSPQTIAVTLEVHHVTAPPFGTFETPRDGSTVRSSIPVTGWVLDDIGVESVKIYLEEGGELLYIGDAVQVEGARPDVEETYPGYPANSKAGWGYMMLTNGLPNGGNGRFTFQVTAVDREGNAAMLGKKTVICDNANAVKPFGAIDMPAQGGSASGGAFVNIGWALTPPPNTIPADGSTIRVWVDGVPLGNPVYNQYREDVATLFPGYNNSKGAGGYFYIDTASYANGVHTIYWTASDDAGNSDGIGSRYFSIYNTGGDAGHGAQSAEHTYLSAIPPDYFAAVGIKKGCNMNTEPQTLYPDDNGCISVETEELQRIEIELGGNDGDGEFYTGYLVVGARLRPLPIGSTLDGQKGIFYWQPGVGFIGRYRFVFIREEKNSVKYRRDIKVRIKPLPPAARGLF